MGDMGATHDLIYGRARLTPLMSPLCNYIPSREITFKLMLACVGCASTEDLWFNQGAGQEEEDERNANIRR